MHADGAGSCAHQNGTKLPCARPYMQYQARKAEASDVHGCRTLQLSLVCSCLLDLAGQESAQGSPDKLQTSPVLLAADGLRLWQSASESLWLRSPQLICGYMLPRRCEQAQKTR